MEKKIKTYNLSKSVINEIHVRAVKDDRKDSDWLNKFLKVALITTQSKEIKPASKTKRFKPPTLNEVQAYCLERNNSVSSQAFLYHYQSNGWMRGKAKVKDWKACVRTWEQNSSNKKSEPDFSDDKTGWANQDYGLIR
jgi:hypothetical protein